MKRFCILFLVTAMVAQAQSSAPLTLNDALSLALRQSKAAQLGHLKVEAAEAELKSARRQAYPQIHAYGAVTYLNDPLDVRIGRGSLTPLLNQTSAQLGLGPTNIAAFPTDDVSLAKGSHTPAVGSLTVAQPLTQLWRIGTGVRAAKAGVNEAQRESDHITAKLRLSVEELFVGMLVQSRRNSEKEATVAWQERKLRDAENARKSGELLDELVLGQRAAVVQACSELMRSRQDYARLSLQLADLIGRPGSDDLVVTDQLPTREEHPLGYWTAQAANNPERLIAAATLEKASAGVRAARQAYIPEVSLFGGGFAQDGTPLAARHTGTAGLTLSWDVFDFGRRKAEIARATSQRRAAEVNRDRLEEEAARQIRLAYQDVTYADEQITLAREALAYRQRAAELSHQSVGNGLALDATALEADAQLRKSEVDLTGALCQRHLSLLHLYFLSGKL